MKSELPARFAASASVTLPAVAGVLGACLILLATCRYGVALSPDSVGYLAAAHAILAGQGVLDWSGQPLIVQPPLYPLALAAAVGIAGDRLGDLHAAAWLNALLVAATFFLAGRLAATRWKLPPPWLALFLGTLLAARPLFIVGVTAWSEALFHFWTLMFFGAALAWRDSGKRRHLLLFAGAAGAAVMTRYIGVTVIATGAFALALGPRVRRTHARRLADGAMYLAVAAGPLAWWLLRNHSLSGTWMGPRDGSGFALAQNLVFTAVTLLCWYVPLKELQVFPLLKKLYLAATASSFAAPPATTALALPFARGAAAARRFTASPSLALALFCLLYLGLLIYSSTTTGYDQIADRLLAPVHIPLTLLLFAALARRFPSASPASPRAAAVGFAIGLFMIVAPGAQIASWITGAVRDGLGARDATFGFYNSRPWRESPTLAYVRAHGSDDPIYSNSTPSLFLWADRVATSLPAAPGSHEWLRADRVTVVWLRNEFHETRDPIPFFEGLEWVIHGDFEDGAVYRVSRDSSRAP